MKSRAFAPCSVVAALLFGSAAARGVLTIDYDYTFEDGASFTPQIQIRYLARTGYIDVHCRIPNTGIRSNIFRINVFGGIKQSGLPLQSRTPAASSCFKA